MNVQLCGPTAQTCVIFGRPARPPGLKRPLLPSPPKLGRLIDLIRVVLFFFSISTYSDVPHKLLASTSPTSRPAQHYIVHPHVFPSLHHSRSSRSLTSRVAGFCGAAAARPDLIFSLHITSITDNLTLFSRFFTFFPASPNPPLPRDTYTMLNGQRRPSRRQPFWHGQEFSTPEQAHLAIRRWQSTLRAAPGAEDYLVWDPNTSIVRCVAPTIHAEQACVPAHGHPPGHAHETLGTGTCPFRAIVQRQSFLPAPDPCDASGYFAFYCTPHTSACIASSHPLRSPASTSTSTNANIKTNTSPGESRCTSAITSASTSAIPDATDAQEMALDAPARPRKRMGDASASLCLLSPGSDPGPGLDFGSGSSFVSVSGAGHQGPPPDSLYLEAVVRHMHVLLASPLYRGNGYGNESEEKNTFGGATTMLTHVHDMLGMAAQAFASGVPPAAIAHKLHDWLLAHKAPLPLWPPDPFAAPPAMHGASRCTASAPSPATLGPFAPPPPALVVPAGESSSPYWSASTKRARRWY